MATAASKSKETQQQGRPSDQLTDEQLLQLYRTMVLARKVDERSWVMNRQGRAPFHISGIGHEAIQVAAAATRSTPVKVTIEFSPVTGITRSRPAGVMTELLPAMAVT